MMSFKSRKNIGCILRMTYNFGNFEEFRFLIPKSQILTYVWNLEI